MTRRSQARARLWIAALVAGTLALLGLTAAPVLGADPSQVQRGADVYAANCAVCHGANLDGGAGPPLTEPGLHNRYATALVLYQNVKITMPLGGDGPGSLSDADYLAAVAFILNARGVTYAGGLSAARAADVVLAPTATPVPAAATPVPTAAPTPTPVATPAASGNTPPHAPIVIEPAPVLLTREQSPFFMALQTAPFADADVEDRHTATEFEIRDFRSGVRVWSSLVRTWLRDQTVLERGVFEGPLAGRMGLEHKTVYAIRARHRDSSLDPAERVVRLVGASRHPHRPAGPAEPQPNAPARHPAVHPALGGGGRHARDSPARKFTRDYGVGEPAARNHGRGRPQYRA